MATGLVSRILLTAEDQTAAAFAAISRSFEGMEVSIESARVALLGYAAVAGAALLAVNDQVEKIAAFQTLAEKIGDTAEAMASLKLASDISGVALDEIADASVALTTSLSQTEDDSEGVGAAITALGLNLQAFKSMSPVEQIDELAKSLALFKDGADKTAVATAIFGEEGASLIPLFNDLAGGAQRQISLTSEQIAGTAAYTKQTAALRSEVETMTLGISAGAVPALSQMVAILQETFKASNDASLGASLLGAALGTTKTAMEAVVLAGSDVAFVFKSIGDSIGAYAAVSARLLAGDLAGAKAIGLAYKAAGEDRRNTLDSFQRRIARPAIISPDDQSDAESRRLGLTRVLPKLPELPKPPKPPRGPGGASAAKDPYAEANRYLATLQKQLEATDKLGAADALLRDIQLGRLGKTTPAIEAALLATAQQLDLDKELEAATKAALDLKTETLRKNEELAEAGRRVYESTREPLELLNIEQAKLNDLLAAGVLTFDTFARASLDLEERYRNGPAAAISELDKFTQKAAENIQDALGDTFANIMDGNFKDIGDGFTKLMNRMVAEAAAAQLAESLFGKKGAGGGLLGNVLGSIGGALFPGLSFGGARAAGGPVNKGRAYLVGEQGPEMFMPNIAGAIIPNNKLGGGGQTISVTNNFSVSGPVDRRTEMQLAAAAQRGLAMGARNL